MMFKELRGFGGRAKKPLAKILESRLEKTRSSLPGQSGVFFERWIDPTSITQTADKARREAPAGEAVIPRERVYTAPVTLGAMLGQCLSGGSQREAVARLRSERVAEGLKPPSPGTASYSQACTRLPIECVQAAHRGILQRAPAVKPLIEGTRVLAVDGTGVQLADTPINQAHFPQPSNQAEGCGFPVLHLVGLFELDRGLMVAMAQGPLAANENGLFQTELMAALGPRDLLVADRGFCSFYHTAALKAQGADVLMRLRTNRAWPKDQKGDDLRVSWTRPRRRDLPSHLTDEEYAALPEKIEVRYVRFRVEIPGMRSRMIRIVTTRMDLTVEQIAAIYLRRWSIELSFDDLKTTLGMDFVNAKTPAMAAKLVWLYLIVHNLLRLLMLQAAQLPTAAPSHRLSFKGTLDRTLQCLEAMKHQNPRVRERLIDDLLMSIARDPLPWRPFRFEPRVIKRRPKSFPRMTRPRKSIKSPESHPKSALLTRR